MINRIKTQYPYAKSLSEEDIRAYITQTIAAHNELEITQEEFCVRMGKAIAYAECGWMVGELNTRTALDFVITAENRLK